MTTRIVPNPKVHSHFTLAFLSLVAGASLAGCDAAPVESDVPPPDDVDPTNPLTTEAAGLCRGIALPADQAFVADGLCVRAVAMNQGKLRQITFSTRGDLIGVTSSGSILRYRDENGDGYFEGASEIVAIGDTGGNNGNNAVFDEHETFLYVGTPDGVARYAYSDTGPLGAAEPVVVGQPSSGTHKLHTVRVYGASLYVHSGSEGNAFAPALPDYDTERSVLKRFQLSDFTGTPFDWADGEVYFSGIRNMVGFNQNPRDGELYGVVNGLDDLVYQGEDIHDTNPGEDLIRLDRGMAHGYPYCFTAQHIEATGEQRTAEGTMIPAGTQLAGTVQFWEGEPAFENPHDDAWCATNSTPPLTFFPAHSAPLDLLFVSNAGALPAAWEGHALVALHGSWDTSTSVGHQVVKVATATGGSMDMPKADMEGTLFEHEVIFGGAETDGVWGWASGQQGEYPVRPVGLAISPVDGALYVSSDNAAVLDGIASPEQGVIYRIALAQPE